MNEWSIIGLFVFASTGGWTIGWAVAPRGWKYTPIAAAGVSAWSCLIALLGAWIGNHLRGGG